MKKLLLASIIMFGICSFVTAQKTTATKSSRVPINKSAASTTTPALTNSAGITPSKAAVSTNDLNKPVSTQKTDAEMANTQTEKPVTVKPVIVKPVAAKSGINKKN